MKVFNPSDSDIHILTYTPRFHVDFVDIKVTSQLNTVYDQEELSTANLYGYYSTAFELPINEGQDYFIEVRDFDTKKVVYRTKMFATAQTDLENYTTIQL